MLSTKEKLNKYQIEKVYITPTTRQVKYRMQLQRRVSVDADEEPEDEEKEYTSCVNKTYVTKKSSNLLCTSYAFEI